MTSGVIVEDSIILSPKSYVEEYICLSNKFSVERSVDDVSPDDQFKLLFEKYKGLKSDSKDFFNKLFEKDLLPSQILDFHDGYIVSNVKPEVNNQFSIELRLLKYEKDENGYYEVDGNNVKFFISDKHRDSFRSFGNKTQSIISLVYDGTQLGIVSYRSGKYRGFVMNDLEIKDVKISEAISRKKKLKW